MHITDIGSLYSLVYSGALKGSIGHGKAGYYFGISGEYTLLSAVSALGSVLVSKKLADQSQPTTLSEEEMQKYYGGSFYMGTNSRGRADRSKSIGWKPVWTDERDFLRDVGEQVGKAEEKWGRVWNEAPGKL